MKQPIKSIFKIATVFYAAVVSIYIIQISAGRGDEFYFISDLNLIESNGWITAIEKGISIPYLLLAYPLTFIFKKHIALRLVSLFLTIGLFFYFKKRNNLPISFYFYLLFYLATTIFFFYGTNDTLFNVSLIIFFNEVYLLYSSKKINTNIAFIALVIAFFTRALTLVYFPIILIGLFIIYRLKNDYKLKLVYPIITLVVSLILNIPSLKTTGNLSYDVKHPPKNIDATWGQRQYLAQVLINKGELQKGSHPTWAETQKYINTNGKESLPVSLFDAIFFDFKLTIKEFFKDLGNTLFLGFRQLGLMLVLILIIPMIKLFKNRKLDYNIFIPASFLIMIIIFSFIIISNVELRWLAPVFVMALVWFSDLESKKQLSNNLLILNYLSLIVLVSYGSYRMIDKLML